MRRRSYTLGIEQVRGSEQSIVPVRKGIGVGSMYSLVEGKEKPQFEAFFLTFHKLAVGLGDDGEASD